MEIAIISDLHLGVRSNSQFFMEKQEEFFYSTFFPALEERGIDTVWCLGDFFENRKMLSVLVLNQAVKLLQEFQDRNLKLYMILGNHDVYYKNTNEVSSIPPVIRSFPNVHLVNKFELIDFDGLSVGFVNWIPEMEKEECITWIQSVDANVICGHFEINDFEMVKGVYCSSGWFDSSWFERFDRVFSGHFHISATNGPIQYIGNQYQTNWGEAFDQKGFLIFDTKTDKVEFVRNPVDIYKVIEFKNDINIMEFDFSECQDRIVRLVVKESHYDKQKLEMFVDMLSAESHAVEVIDEHQVLVDDEAVTDDVVNTGQIINQFLESCDASHLDKEYLKKMAFEIYKEAVEKDDD